MLEWYGAFPILFSVGETKFSTYGMVAGAGGPTCMLAMMRTARWLGGEEGGKVATPFVCFVCSVLPVLGWRLCSAAAEDCHLINDGKILLALKRPGFLEAGVWPPVVAFLLSVAVCSNSISSFWLLCDSFCVAYYAMLFFTKLGCVSYGCCWGALMEKAEWYSTYYSHPESKCIRMRPDLAGKPLFPVSTMMAFLFLKNSAIGVLIGCLGVYSPGMIVAILPHLNALDKKVYFPLRGDGEESSFDEKEDFRMLSPAEKKRHCEKWSIPARVVSLLALANLLCEWMGSEIALCFLSFTSLFFLFGYHFPCMGCWCTERCNPKREGSQKGD